MDNKQIITRIFEVLETEHLNLYHTITKEKMLEKINSIKNLNDLTPLKFDYEMLKLFASLKDGHTTYFTPFVKLNYKFWYLNNKLYVKINNRFEEVLKFKTTPASDVVSKIKKLINYETNEWLNEKISEFVNNGYILKMLNLFNDDRVEITVNILGQPSIYVVTKNTDTTPKPKKVPYGFKVLDHNILYVWYKSCFSFSEYPFENMVKDIEAEIDKNNIVKFIMDVRDNGGGNSEILNPLQELFISKHLTGAMLINNGVFSSGRFAVARFKKHLGVTLIGEGTGGAAKSYGYNKNLEVEDKKFSCSIRLWDFSDIFGYTGSIKPDIFVKTTIEDINNKNDVVLKTAVEHLKNN